MSKIQKKGNSKYAVKTLDSSSSGGGGAGGGGGDGIQNPHPVPICPVHLNIMIASSGKFEITLSFTRCVNINRRPTPHHAHPGEPWVGEGWPSRYIYI